MAAVVGDRNRYGPLVLLGLGSRGGENLRDFGNAQHMFRQHNEFPV
jgi:hypothetical protein